LGCVGAHPSDDGEGDVQKDAAAEQSLLGQAAPKQLGAPLFRGTEARRIAAWSEIRVTSNKGCQLEREAVNLTHLTLPRAIGFNMLGQSSLRISALISDIKGMLQRFLKNLNHAGFQQASKIRVLRGDFEQNLSQV